MWGSQQQPPHNPSQPSPRRTQLSAPYALRSVTLHPPNCTLNTPGNRSTQGPPPPPPPPAQALPTLVVEETRLLAPRLGRKRAVHDAGAVLRLALNQLLDGVDVLAAEGDHAVARLHPRVAVGQLALLDLCMARGAGGGGG